MPGFPRLGLCWVSGSRDFRGDAVHATLAAHRVVILGWYNSLETEFDKTLESLIDDVRARSPLSPEFYTYINHQQVWGDAVTEDPKINEKLGNMDWWAYSGATTSGPETDAVSSEWAVATGDNIRECNVTSFAAKDLNGATWPEWHAQYQYDKFYSGATFSPIDPTEYDFEPYSITPAPSLTGFLFDNAYLIPKVDANWNLTGENNELTSPETYSAWREGYVTGTTYLREKLEKSAIANLSDLLNTYSFNFDVYRENGQNESFGQYPIPEYHLQFNGGIIESWVDSRTVDDAGNPVETGHEKYADTESLKRAYKRFQDSTLPPNHNVYFVVCSNTQIARMGLALNTVLGDGYTFLMPSNGAASSPVWLDELSVNLTTGETYSGYTAADVTNGYEWLGSPIDPGQADQPAWQDGVYRRRFENGWVLWNPRGNGTKILNLGATMRKLKGTQAPDVNNGEVVTSVTLQDRDGLFLLNSALFPVLEIPPETFANPEPVVFQPTRTKNPLVTIVSNVPETVTLPEPVPVSKTPLGRRSNVTKPVPPPNAKIPEFPELPPIVDRGGPTT